MIGFPPQLFRSLELFSVSSNCRRLLSNVIFFPEIIFSAVIFFSDGISFSTAISRQRRITHPVSSTTSHFRRHFIDSIGTALFRALILRQRGGVNKFILNQCSEFSFLCVNNSDNGFLDEQTHYSSILINSLNKNQSQRIPYTYIVINIMKK